MRSPPFATIVILLAAGAGFTFAGVSTYDFTAHLDRQVHGLHCSFLPGVGVPDMSGSTGCHATLMSPYSSILRSSVWGGIPVALAAMGVFAYLAALAVGLYLLGRSDDRRALGYQVLAWGLPVLTSLVFGGLSLVELDALCKLCVGIYASSAVGFVVSIFAWSRTAKVKPAPTPTPDIAADDTIEDVAIADAAGETLPARPRLATASSMDRKLRIGRSALPAPGATPVSLGRLGVAFAIGVAFVVLPVTTYALAAPDFSRFVGACGTLAHPDEDGSVLVALGAQRAGDRVTEILDPLCPSCRGLERRFAAHPAAASVSRRVLLFPLDSECNWMVDRAIHPGACAVARAILCAEGEAEAVLDWAFARQESLREQGAADPASVERAVREAFPGLTECMGSSRVRARLNRSLRWAVSNQLPVLTPQVYVNETRVCDEDTDLGLDFVLTRLTERGAR